MPDSKQEESSTIRFQGEGQRKKRYNLAALVRLSLSHRTAGTSYAYGCSSTGKVSKIPGTVAQLSAVMKLITSKCTGMTNGRCRSARNSIKTELLGEMQKCAPMEKVVVSCRVVPSCPELPALKQPSRSCSARNSIKIWNT